MERLCERPGCSDPASVSYGMRAADMVFWIDALGAGEDSSPGVLCRRHADSMVVPRNWTLDDLRDPDLHLFRPPASGSPDRPRRRRTVRRPTTEQLELGIEPPADGPGGELPTASPAAASDAIEHADSDGAPSPPPWTPTFDGDDDLDGLLAARSPLLARAFRGADRPRSP